VIELINCMGPDGFDNRDLKLLEALADFAAIALENARHVKRIHELTITDDCTTLYNARHMGFILDTEIYRSQRYNYEFSLVFIDLDHFKQVNDTHGHLVGSRLLAEIGNAATDLQRERVKRGAAVTQDDQGKYVAGIGRVEYQGYDESGSGFLPGGFQVQGRAAASG
jgi:GGDEF domain-containing protein